MTSSAAAARPEAAIRQAWAAAAPRRTKKTMTATDAVAIRSRTPRAPTLPPQVNRRRTGAVGSPAGPSSVTAKAITTTTEITVWSSEPVPGAPLALLVRAKAAGSRPSRPMAKA